MSNPSLRAAYLLVFGLLAACNTAPVLPPEDLRAFALVETSLWSGGRLEVVVRHAHDEQPIPAIKLDGTALVVSRLDDTTFRAALPVRTGGLPVRIESEEIPPLEATVELHGFVSAQLGPGVGGSVLPLPGSGGQVILGATRSGLASVSLATGQVVSTWSKSVHAIECANGVVPGPAVGQVVLRAGVEGAQTCASHYTLHETTPVGVGAGLGEVMPGWSRSIAAVVGPQSAVLGWHDNFGSFLRCGAGSPWVGCQQVEPFSEFQANLYGFEAGYTARRIIGLGIRPAIHHLGTGDIVRILPSTDDSDLLYYHSAAFNSTERRLFLTAFRSALTSSPSGLLLVLDSENGVELDRRELVGGDPNGVAIDDARGLVYVAMHSPSERRYWLTVLDAATLELVAELPAPSGTIEDAVRQNGHRRLILPVSGNMVILVATQYTPWFTSATIPPMVIARWSLAD